jgi:hypothetical protein
MLRSILSSSLLLSLVSLIQALDPKTVIDANGISLFDKIEEMERQLLQPATLNSLVEPCSLNAQADPNEGQQTSAEWVRTVFHDCITKGIAGPGLGWVMAHLSLVKYVWQWISSGLDASIGFESDRPENIGVFVNVTIGQVGDPVIFGWSWAN